MNERPADRLARTWIAACAGAGLVTCSPAVSSSGAGEPSPPPPTPQVEVIERLSGVEVSDPYRWLEQMSSAEVETWVQRQDQRAREYLESRADYVGVRGRVETLAAALQIGDYVERAGRAIYLEGGGGLPQPRLVVEDLASGARRVLVDPTMRSADGRIAIADSSLSPRGDLLAVALVDGPSRFFEWSFFDLATGRERPDRLVEAKIGTGPSTLRNPWSADRSSFFYTRYTRIDRDDPLTPPGGLVVFRHRLGRPQTDDVAVYSRPDDDGVRFDASVTRDGRFLLVHEWAGNPDGDAIWLLSIEGEARPRRLLGSAGSSFAWMGSDGDRFWFRTDDRAPRSRVLEIDRRRPEREAWREIVPESDSTLSQAHRFGSALVLAYLRDVRNVLEIRSLDGRLEHRVDFPDGLVWQYTQRYWSGITGDPEGGAAFVRSLGPSSAGSIYRLELATGTLSLARRAGTPFPIERTVTRQVVYESHDGVRVPMFLVGLDPAGGDRPRPTLLWVYGAYGWTAQPFLNPMIAVWLERGGVLAMPNVRGGGAYGEAWRLAGSRAEKLNTVRDTVAAAEWLIGAGVSQPRLLAVFGNSAGATAAAGALATRPELFAAGVFEVPVADPIRARRFTGGAGWTETFGDPAIAHELRAMLQYSPYHRALAARCTPPVLVTAGDRDVTAVPMHAYKLTAAFQNANRDCVGGSSPVLLRVDWGSDHGMNKPMPNLWAEQSAELAFLLALLPPGGGD